MLDISGMLDRSVDTILYGDEKSRKEKEVKKWNLSVCFKII